MAELNLTPVGKLFFASLIAWLVHDTKFNWKLRGSPDKVQAMAKAIISSKRFQQEMAKEGATVESVIAKLNLKNISANEFTSIVGAPWPL